MDADQAHTVFSVAQAMQASCERWTLLPSEVRPPSDQAILSHALFRGTRGYMEKVVYQINATYSATCYDACAVMIRRLLEMLIIEVYEHAGRSSEIKDGDNNYFMLDTLTNRLLDGSWKLSRTAKLIKDMKHFGDLSAHSRMYNAQRPYVDAIIIDLRVITEELLYLAGLRR